MENTETCFARFVFWRCVATTKPRSSSSGREGLGLVGAEVADEQAALRGAWQGDTGMTYQAWQAQWNTALEELVRAYRAMASTHEMNTTSMAARDQAEGAKWG